MPRLTASQEAWELPSLRVAAAAHRCLEHELAMPCLYYTSLPGSFDEGFELAQRYQDDRQETDLVDAEDHNGG